MLDYERSNEIINEARIELANSHEYNLGRRILNAKKLLKEGKLIALFKVTRRHNKIKRLSGNFKTATKTQAKPPARNKLSDKKVVVYTCITGGYDEFLEPLSKMDGVDYVLFTDSDVIADKKKRTLWSIKKISDRKEMSELSNSDKNRYIKFHPFEIFKDKYDYAIYIDGNICPVGDMREMINCVNNEYGIAMHQHRERSSVYKEAEVCKILGKGNKSKIDRQIKRYWEDQFPDGYGMAEANMIVVDLRNRTARNIVDQWWGEYVRSGSGRDQLALPYVLWKNKIKVENISTLGENVYTNPKIAIFKHAEDLA